ncbi:hypothetical protein BT69DRAFT_792961 [Atractiella rhizophila]|nr:hypothetical protein BT69DRAFT_792961 [Atractiella rhizophila]
MKQSAQCCLSRLLLASTASALALPCSTNNLLFISRSSGRSPPQAVVNYRCNTPCPPLVHAVSRISPICRKFMPHKSLDHLILLRTASRATPLLV